MDSWARHLRYTGRQTRIGSCGCGSQRRGAHLGPSAAQHAYHPGHITDRHSAGSPSWNGLDRSARLPSCSLSLTLSAGTQERTLFGSWRVRVHVQYIVHATLPHRPVRVALSQSPRCTVVTSSQLLYLVHHPQPSLSRDFRCWSSNY